MPKSPRQTRLNGEATRARILDAAESLFGAQGFDAVSLRDITRQAGVTLALASYHFGSKENLFEEVVARRAAMLGDERLARLAALGRPNVEAILDAFMAPLFQRAQGGEAGWHAYFRVLARLGEGDRWLDLLSRHFDSTARVFLEALGRARPAADSAALARGFTMMLTLMLAAVAQHGRLDRLSNGAAEASDLQGAYAPLLRFVVAGFNSVTE